MVTAKVVAVEDAVVAGDTEVTEKVDEEDIEAKEKEDAAEEEEGSAVDAAMAKAEEDAVGEDADPVAMALRLVGRKTSRWQFELVTHMDIGKICTTTTRRWIYGRFGDVVLLMRVY